MAVWGGALTHINYHHHHHHHRSPGQQTREHCTDKAFSARQRYGARKHCSLAGVLRRCINLFWLIICPTDWLIDRKRRNCTDQRAICIHSWWMDVPLHTMMRACFWFIQLLCRYTADNKFIRTIEAKLYYKVCDQPLPNLPPPCPSPPSPPSLRTLGIHYPTVLL